MTAQADCLRCQYKATHYALICAVNPSLVGDCADFSPQHDRKYLREKLVVQYVSPSSSRTFDLALAYNVGEVYVRGFYWENFRYETEGIEFINDHLQLGCAIDDVGSSLIRQTTRKRLPTLGEFLSQYGEVSSVSLHGIQIPVQIVQPEDQPETSPTSEWITIAFYEADEDDLIEIDQVVCRKEQADCTISKFKQMHPECICHVVFDEN